MKLLSDAGAVHWGDTAGRARAGTQKAEGTGREHLQLPRAAPAAGRTEAPSSSPGSREGAEAAASTTATAAG